jgi:hypothetical protein
MLVLNIHKLFKEKYIFPNKSIRTKRGIKNHIQHKTLECQNTFFMYFSCRSIKGSCALYNSGLESFIILLPQNFKFPSIT